MTDRFWFSLEEVALLVHACVTVVEVKEFAHVQEVGVVQWGVEGDWVDLEGLVDSDIVGVATLTYQPYELVV